MSIKINITPDIKPMIQPWVKELNFETSPMTAKLITAALSMLEEPVVEPVFEEEYVSTPYPCIPKSFVLIVDRENNQYLSAARSKWSDLIGKELCVSYNGKYIPVLLGEIIF